MPLNTPRKSDAWDGFRDVVAFPAEDSETLTHVRCAISQDALAEHFGGLPGSVASLLGAFRRYRPAIERAASDKYDAQGKPDALVLQPADFARDGRDLGTIGAGSSRSPRPGLAR